MGSSPDTNNNNNNNDTDGELGNVPKTRNPSTGRLSRSASKTVSVLFAIVCVMVGVAVFANVAQVVHSWNMCAVCDCNNNNNQNHEVDIRSILTPTPLVSTGTTAATTTTTTGTCQRNSDCEVFLNMTWQPMPVTCFDQVCVYENHMQTTPFRRVEEALLQEVCKVQLHLSLPIDHITAFVGYGSMDTLNPNRCLFKYTAAKFSFVEDPQPPTHSEFSIKAPPPPSVIVD